MKLQSGTIVRMSEEQAESLLTLVNDQIEDLRHCNRCEGRAKKANPYLRRNLIAYITHYRNIRRTLKDLHYINTEKIRSKMAQDAINSICPS